MAKIPPGILAWSALLLVKSTVRHETKLFASLLALLTVLTAGAEAQSEEKLFSPDKSYSVEIVRNTENFLLLSKGGKTIAKVPTQVGPEGSFFQTLWSPDGCYVAINKQRSSRTGGDEMWIVALPSGKVLRQPDDALWNELDERASAYIDEKRLSETKVSLTLTATGWGKGGLCFRLEAWFGELQDGYRFEGMFNPSDRKIRDWKISKAK